MRHECLVEPEELGSLLMGELDPAERDRIDAAVAACPSCTAEVRALRPAVASLALASDPALGPMPADRPEVRPAVGANPFSPPPEGFERLLDSMRGEQVRRQGRRWPRRALVAAVAAAVVLLGAAGVAVSLREDGTRVELAAVGAGRVGGSAVVEERAWGTAIELTVRGLEPGEAYGAWLEDRSGERVGAGTFTPTASGSMRLELSARLALDDAGAVGVTRIDGETFEDVLRHDF